MISQSRQCVNAAYHWSASLLYCRRICQPNMELWYPTSKNLSYLIILRDKFNLVNILELLKLYSYSLANQWKLQLIVSSYQAKSLPQNILDQQTHPGCGGNLTNQHQQDGRTGNFSQARFFLPYVHANIISPLCKIFVTFQ